VKIMITVSVGDFIDRMSILSIKKSYGLPVDKELNEYQENPVIHKGSFSYFFNILKSINSQLWDLEDAKRKGVERFSRQESDVAFLITQLNDLRYQVKKTADIFFESDISEEKSH